MRVRTLGVPIMVAALVIAASAPVARAAEWRTIRPGESTQGAVREQFGQPTKVTSQKVEGYDTAQWIYEEPQAPAGTVRMVIDFGLLTAQGYRADVVREMMVEPRRGVFTRTEVVEGWGEPDVADVEGDAKVLRYRSGLFVYFDKEGWIAQKMYFTPPQPAAPAQVQPRR